MKFNLVWKNLAAFLNLLYVNLDLIDLAWASLGCSFASLVGLISWPTLWPTTCWVIFCCPVSPFFLRYLCNLALITLWYFSSYFVSFLFEFHLGIGHYFILLASLICLLWLEFDHSLWSVHLILFRRTLLPILHYYWWCIFESSASFPIFQL